MLYLKQSTATQNVLIGPFVDSTDGVTAETGLTIANTDIRLSKNGANIAAKNSGGGTHDENGWYQITLDATDTNTVGRLQLHCVMSGALPVWAEFWVLEEDIYEALFAASAAAFNSSDQVTVGSIAANAVTASSIASNAITAAKIATDAITAAKIAADAIGSSELATTAVNEIRDAILSDSTAFAGANIAAILTDTGTTLQADLDDIQTRLPAALVSGRMSSDMVALSGSTAAADNLEESAKVILVRTVDTVTNTHTPTTTEFQADDVTEATADHYIGRVVIFTSGALLGQATDITDYAAVGGIGQFTVTAMTDAPANNDTFIIV